MSPRENEIHARFCSAHAPPRARPDDAVRGERLRHEPFGLHEVAAEQMRDAELAQHVGAARVVAELAPPFERLAQRLVGRVVRADRDLGRAELA